jgi:ubiquinone/menaquinone biosynthesis C-methylase UbiE
MRVSTPAEAPSNAPANFDRLARVYRWMEYASFGRALERCRFFHLYRCADARRALVLGDGDGRYTQRLAQSNASVQIDAADASQSMLQALRGRVARLGPQASARLCTLHCDLRSFMPEPSGYDLVVTHFFLDCLSDAEASALMERVQPTLAPDAVWVVSEFSIPQRGWMRLPARLVVALLYRAFGWMTRLSVRRIPDYAAAMRRSGFELEARQPLLCGLLTAELWRLQRR